MKRTTSCILSALCAMLVGCYTLEPTGITPQPGLIVALDINDLGRVGLGDQVGTGITQIEGTLISKDSAEYLVAVTAVRTFRGGEQVWRGEQVRIKSSYVSLVYERRFSKTRTVMASALGIGAVAAIFGQGIFGDGPKTLDPLLPDTANSVRIPRP